MSAVRKKILIVDDDPDLRRLLGLRLRASYDVAFAADCVLAMTVARREQPDLLLLDLMLPGGEGFLVMERLLDVPSLARTPVIVLTARAGDELEDRAAALGARAFLRKPFAFGDLQDAIDDVFDDAAAA
jgi:CheY-like chemotaxis protein